MVNNPLSFIDPSGLTANNPNAIIITNQEQIQKFWEWLVNNWENNQDDGSSWAGGGSIMDGIWSYLTSGGFGRQGALGYDQYGNPGIYFQWWAPITGQAYQNIQSTLANTSFTVPWALHNEFRRLDYINPLMYKNKETMSFRGHDFMLYHNEWHRLSQLREIPLQGYQDPFDTERKPTQMTMSRERSLQYRLDRKALRDGGLTGGVILFGVGLSGDAFLAQRFALAPISFLVGYISGAAMNAHHWEVRMRQHDQHVDFLRLRLD